MGRIRAGEWCWAPHSHPLGSIAHLTQVSCSVQGVGNSPLMLQVPGWAGTLLDGCLQAGFPGGVLRADHRLIAGEVVGYRG